MFVITECASLLLFIVNISIWMKWVTNECKNLQTIFFEGIIKKINFILLVGTSTQWTKNSPRKIWSCKTCCIGERNDDTSRNLCTEEHVYCISWEMAVGDSLIWDQFSACSCGWLGMSCWVFDDTIWLNTDGLLVSNHWSFGKKWISCYSQLHHTFTSLWAPQTKHHKVAQQK